MAHAGPPPTGGVRGNPRQYPQRRQSRWLLANTTVLRLPPGEKFYEESQVPRGVVPNEFSLFAQTVKRRRAQAAVSPPNP